MRTTLKVSFLLLGIILVITLGVVFDNITMRVPAIYPLGFVFIGCMGFLILFIEVLKGTSPQIFTNRGHYSIRARDIIPIPYQKEYDEKPSSKLDSEDIENDITITNMEVAFTGGVDCGGISVKGRPEDPIFIGPAIYSESEETSFHNHTNFDRVEFAQLPPYIKDFLRFYPSRVKKHTPIYYGTTSHMDCSSTPKNLAIEREKKDSNAENEQLREIIKNLHSQIRQLKESKQKEVFISKGDILNSGD